MTQQEILSISSLFKAVSVRKVYRKFSDEQAGLKINEIILFRQAKCFASY